MSWTAVVLGAVTPSPAAEPVTAQLGGIGVSDWLPVAGTLLAAALAAVVALVVYGRQQAEARRERRAGVYADALRAVEDYVEGPYRIRRRDGSAAARLQLTGHLSDVKSRISYHQALMAVHAPPELYDAYGNLVRTALRHAGPQMTAAWRSRPTRRDRDVPLGAPLPRDAFEAARTEMVRLMHAELT